MARILVIDDDSEYLEMIDLLLQRSGHQVSLSAEGQEGLVMALAEPPDLMILDVMMPGVTGYEICRRLRAEPETACKHFDIPSFFCSERYTANQPNPCTALPTRPREPRSRIRSAFHIPAFRNTPYSSLLVRDACAIRIWAAALIFSQIRGGAGK